MKNLFIIAAMLVSMAAYSQITIVIDQQIITYQNIDNYQFVYPTFNPYICQPQFTEFNNYININIMNIEIPDNEELEEYFDPSTGVIYNTTTPDEFDFSIPPLPLHLIPEEDIGVTNEKELLH
jgi:hypothetical protein